jgi:histone acetyltransferase (RNA polymerase elongator complex component)
LKTGNLKAPYVIPVFIPFQGCPNKCFFCNQNAVTGVDKPLLPGKDELFNHFEKFLSYSLGKKDFVEIAFFGGNFLGMDNDIVLKYLNIAKEYAAGKKNISIRFSTRPDTITNESLELIKKFNVKTIELGVQSMDDTVLKKSGRGHTAKDSLNAADLIKNKFPHIRLGLQVMPGLPGETRTSILKTLDFIRYSLPSYLRIYPLVVLKNTHLEKLYKKGLFKPLDLDQAVEISSLIRDFAVRRNVNIIRTGLPPDGQANDEIVAGPWHPSFGELVIQKSFYKKILIRILSSLIVTENKTLIVKINPKSESSVRGCKNSNFFNLKKRFNFKDIKTKKNTDFQKDSFEICIL